MHYIIIIKSQVILDLVEDMTESLPFVIIGSRINYSKQQTLICKYRKRYSYKYMDNISSHFIIKYKNFQNRKFYYLGFLLNSLILLFNPLFGLCIQLTELYYND